MNKWKHFCQKPLVKAVCLLLICVSTVSGAAGCQWFINYAKDTGRGEEIFFANYGGAGAYTDTGAFTESVVDEVIEVLQYYAVETRLGANGELDEDLVLDLRSYALSGLADSGDSCGVSYRVGDLLRCLQEGQGTSTEEIYVCRKNTAELPAVMENTESEAGDGEYAEEGTASAPEDLTPEEAVDEGAVVIGFDDLETDVWLEESAAASDEESDGASDGENDEAVSDDESDGAVDEAETLYDYMTVDAFCSRITTGDTGDGYYTGAVYLSSGKLLYEDTWIVSIPTLDVDPVEGSWIDLFNTDPDLNGNMVEYAEMLSTLYENFVLDYCYYESGNPYGDTDTVNLRYLIETPEGTVYTNSAALDYMTVRECMEQCREDDNHYLASIDGMPYTNYETGDTLTYTEEIVYPLTYYYSNIADPEAVIGDWDYCFFVDETFPAADFLQSAWYSYAEYAPYAKTLRWLIVASMIVFLLAVIVWTFGIGRTEEGELVLQGFDSLPTEPAAILVIGGAVGFWVVGVWILAHYYHWMVGNYFFVAGVFSIPTALLFCAGYGSLVRRIKAHILWRNSLCARLAAAGGKTASRLGGSLRQAYLGLRLGWRTALAVCGLYCLHYLNIYIDSAQLFFGTIVVDLLVLLAVCRRMRNEEKMSEGLGRICAGDLRTKIDTWRMQGSQKEMAELINHVDDGMQEALEKQMRSERMKTELITNVSHDIKTPLTSIINYVDLLKRETSDPAKNDPEKVREYLAVLEQKSQRLKTLTEDVVEASKISSGTLVYENTVLDLVELLHQVEGDYMERYEQADLTLVRQMPEEPLMVYADGRRLWRVFSNLYQNTVKYAMPHTRVYISVAREAGQAVFTMKNVSQDALNITPDELTERFIRGDRSRTTEGSGLGLSIAKSLTEAMRGRLELYLDGDLFKVMVYFPLYVPPEDAHS